MKQLKTLEQMEEKCGMHNGSEWWLNHLLQPDLLSSCDDDERATLRILERVGEGNRRRAGRD